ncbi:hypothetical protein ACFVRB_13215 [Streptomyces nojiriensis]|uniref:hypothetical protein n=1 Tax=Streptomyces nojiriensis TaxID=66374 RepID=UPI0036DCB1B4
MTAMRTVASYRIALHAPTSPRAGNSGTDLAHSSYEAPSVSPRDVLDASGHGMRGSARGLSC